MEYHPKGNELRTVIFIGKISALSYIKTVYVNHLFNADTYSFKNVYLKTFKNAVIKLLGRNSGSKLINILNKCQKQCASNQDFLYSVDLSNTFFSLGVNACRLYYMNKVINPTSFHHWVMNNVKNINIQSKLLGDDRLIDVFDGFTSGEEPFIKEATKIIQSGTMPASVSDDIVLKNQSKNIVPKKQSAQPVNSYQEHNKYPYLDWLFKLFKK